MKRVRIQRWSGSVLSSRASRPAGSLQHGRLTTVRTQSTATAPISQSQYPSRPSRAEVTPAFVPLRESTQSCAAEAETSAKLAALHARLNLTDKIPLSTLKRALVDASADAESTKNNASLAVLGADLLGYYASEQLMAKYPRLPMSVIFAAMYSFVGPKTLAAISREWGVELVAEPGPEVDPGLLQFKRLPPGTNPNPENNISANRADQPHWRRGISSRMVYDDAFGDIKTKVPEELEGAVSAEAAAATFVRAVVGALTLHAGRSTARRFIKAHILSRHLQLDTLFDFHQPNRDISRLCAREGFDSPVARIISETGRLSRHPVFIVGVYSGRDCLGEGSGASLDEARIRASAAALKAWYLYSPIGPQVPSETEEGVSEFKPVMVDMGEVVA